MVPWYHKGYVSVPSLDGQASHRLRHSYVTLSTLPERGCGVTGLRGAVLSISGEEGSLAIPRRRKPLQDADAAERNPTAQILRSVLRCQFFGRLLSQAFLLSVF